MGNITKLCRDHGPDRVLRSTVLALEAMKEIRLSCMVEDVMRQYSHKLDIAISDEVQASVKSYVRFHGVYGVIGIVSAAEAFVNDRVKNAKEDIRRHLDTIKNSDR